MKKKLSINTLKIDSFITTINETEKQTLYGMDDAESGRKCFGKLMEALDVKLFLNPQQAAKLLDSAVKMAFSRKPYKCDENFFKKNSISPFICPHI